MNSPVPLTLQVKITNWRLKAAEGTLTLDEMKEAIVALREGRLAAAVSSATTTRKKAIAVIPSADDMLADLADL